MNIFLFIVDLDDRLGRSALWLAASLGLDELVVELVDNCKAEIDAVDEHSPSFPLHSSRSSTRTHAVADRTPLYAAVQGNHMGTVRFLLDRKADFKIADDVGRTPLTLAMKLGALRAPAPLTSAEHYDCVDLLFAAGSTLMNSATGLEPARRSRAVVGGLGFRGSCVAHIKFDDLKVRPSPSGLSPLLRRCVCSAWRCSTAACGRAPLTARSSSLMRRPPFAALPAF